MNRPAKHRTKPFPDRLQQFARSLGWFSLGLGAVELLFPKTLSRLVGVRSRPGALVRLLGLREIASGLGILRESRHPGWIWSRVGGDAMDLGLLGLAMVNPRAKHKRLAAATAAVAGVAALDYLCAEEMSRTRKIGGGNGISPSGTIRVKRAITINRSAEDLYRFWRDFENLPRIMYHLESVRTLPDGRSRWIAQGPMGKRVEWEAQITEDRPGEVIAWRTLPGSEVSHTGAIRFEPTAGGRGTIVRVELEYQAPAGILGAAVAKMMRREPGQELQDSLRYFRQLLETGVIPTTVGQSAGQPASSSRKFDLPTPHGARLPEPDFAN
jgi:uncharacterized membrane protein